MKVAERVLDVTSTLEGEKVGMTIDESAIQHIMSVLTDLYSDPEMAIIREYSTNAKDAHVVAGVTRPIEVVLPTALSPFIRIRDYGTGLDADDIRDIYSRYGTSTKRNSDDVVGMLGLGCKSALTYTDQFTLTGIKDGVMTQVSIGRDADGAGSMTIVAQHDTDAEQGVEVTIPAKRGNMLEQKAKQFFKYWTLGDVLVNGEKPEPVTGQKITDTIYVVEGQQDNVVVMGNVPYPVPDEFFPAVGQRNHVVAFVDIGTVQFTPSRESLQMTKLTKDALTALGETVRSKLEESIRRNIKDAPNYTLALQALYEGQTIIKVRDPEYKGQPMVGNLARKPKNYTPGMYYDAEQHSNSFLTAYPTTQYRGSRKTGDRRFEVDLLMASNSYGAPREWKQALWFDGFEGKNLTVVKRDKLEEYLRLNGLSGQHARWVFIDKLTPDEKKLIDGQTIIQWADVDAIKLTDTIREKGESMTGNYVMAAPGLDKTEYRSYTKTAAAKIDTTKPILWVHGREYNATQDPAIRGGYIPKDSTVVVMSGNRVEKFKRDFPTAVTPREYMTAQMTKAVKGVDKDDKLAAMLQMDRAYHLLGKLDASRVDDPELAEHIRLATKEVRTTITILQNASKWLGQSIENQLRPWKQYPLMQHVGTTLDAAGIEGLYTYVNAAYAARKES